MTQAALIQTDVLAGPMAVSYQAPGAGSFSSLGVIEAEGVRVLWQPNVTMYDCDQYGEGTFINGIYHGGNHFLEFKLKEANKSAVRSLAYPYNETSPGYGLDYEMGVIGSHVSASAGELKLTPVAGTAAAAETNPVRTFGIVILAPGHSIDAMLKGSMPKILPIRLLCLPYIVSSRRVWFTRGSS